MPDELFENMASHRIAWALSRRTDQELGDVSPAEVAAAPSLFEALVDAAACSPSFKPVPIEALGEMLEMLLAGSDGSWGLVCNLLWPEFRIGGERGVWWFGESVAEAARAVAQAAG